MMAPSDPRTVVLTFGKYRGSTVGAVERHDIGYIHWLAFRAQSIPPNVRAASRAIITMREAALPDALASPLYRRPRSVSTPPDRPSTAASRPPVEATSWRSDTPTHVAPWQQRRSSRPVAQYIAGAVGLVVSLLVIGSVCRSSDDTDPAVRPSPTPVATVLVALPSLNPNRSALPRATIQPTPAPTPPPVVTQTVFADEMEGSIDHHWLVSGAGSLFHRSTRKATSGSASAYAGDAVTGHYAPNTNTTMQLRSPVAIPIGGRSRLCWMFVGSLDCGTRGYGIDSIVAEVRAGTGPWVEVWRTCQSPRQWQRVDLDLTPYAGSAISLRFRFVETGQYNDEGPYLDDIRIDFVPN